MHVELSHSPYVYLPTYLPTYLGTYMQTTCVITYLFRLFMDWYPYILRLLLYLHVIA